jgi:hypothetical protein
MSLVVYFISLNLFYVNIDVHFLRKTDKKKSKHV